jgi:hypothetical protein
MLTAGDIVGFADRQGFKLERGGCAKPTDPHDNCACPRRTLANEVTKSESMYNKVVIKAIQERFGLTEYDQEALEDGFEGFNGNFRKSNKYYKMGKKLAGLVNSKDISL